MSQDDLKTGAPFLGLVGEPLRLRLNAALSATMDVLTKLRQQLRDQGYALVVEIFDQLQRLGAVRIERRDTGQGYGFSVASLEYGHPPVQRPNDL